MYHISKTFSDASAEVRDREKKKKKIKLGAEHPLRHSLKGKYVGIRGEKRKASKKR
jgi:hypothetical protein